ncbi:helix-hairpin-helix domain-containing protein [Thalassotalea litorea]|uniref:Helix-hairpin-helix domain-containing protein n=1 Tax=Thalassotalea litorea TaxID=2020715 RepID=A0A5R9IRE0_9GAMM|nr:helix-hairpin-helix domain-containing protein [Thalassotalea litorea]TLU68095.1 helix-hairpin-helix domain-containing protein [Thalassotalea litorea]
MNKLCLTLFIALSIFGGACHAANAASVKVEQSAQVDSVNLNQADLQELQKISGLGAKKAQAIIDYREVNGPFTDVKQLLNVKGIGEKFLLKNGKSLRL